jgi:hypothetical protein
MNAAQHRCPVSAVPFASAAPMFGVVVIPRLVARRHVDLARVSSALCSRDA